MLTQSDLYKAISWAVELHDGQRRKYIDKPYVLHPLEVAAKLEAYGYDIEVQIAAVLHDVVEDCAATPGEIARKFNVRVATLVDEVTNRSRARDGNRAARADIDLAHLTGCSPEAASIKLVDISVNVPSITAGDAKFAAVYVREKAAQLEVLRHGHPVLFARALDIVEQASAECGI